ncbi:MAG TPA: hypothetical protein OQH54_07935 [Nitrosopumilus sp.]|nr:hypothetical protein [Thermoproteota archaeon]HJJ23625.1 hypothetical protein [Nitrosopumilus sp.]
MSQDQENLKKSVKEYSDKLAKLGIVLSEIQFSYKVKEKPSKEYWQKRIDDFKKYNEKGMQYYNQVYSLMNLVSKEESQMFLLRISKFHHLGLALIKIMEQIKENPSISNSKDKQQSQWSKEIKNQITEHSNICLHHEMDMNTSFREFYEKHLKKILE